MHQCFILPKRSLVKNPSSLYWENLGEVTIENQQYHKSIMTEPWNFNVRGTQVLPLINTDAPIIRVEAGPGTGKTFGLVRRVQRILHPDGLGVSGHEVLIAAFNRVIAKQLKSEIDDLLGSTPHDGAPVIKTVHALCLSIIGGELRLLLPHEREAMIYDVLHLHPELQQRYVKHRETEQALRNHEAKHEDHTQLWQAVQKWLIRHKAHLISDLPGLMLDKLKIGDFDDKSYRHVIVDEFQDLTAGEQALLFKLRHPDGNFVALGDSRQSIYLFRGNEREGLAKLDEMAEEPITDVPMTECQRCPSEIVSAANQLMSLYDAKPMTPGSTERANLHLVHWGTPQAEVKGMAKAIVENRKAFPDETHLVMVSRRQFGFWLRDKLNEIDPNLKVDLSFSESLLETWCVREAFLFFCLIVDPDTPTWRAWLGYKSSSTGKAFKPPKRNAPAYLKVLTDSQDCITEEIVRKLAAEPKNQNRGEGGSNIWERATRFLTLKDELKWDGLNPEALLDEIFDITKWNTDEMEDPETSRLDMQLVLDKTKALLNEFRESDSEEDVNSEELLRKVAQSLRYQIATREPFAPGEEADIHVSTFWGAKGLTAKHVFVIGLCEETIPGTKREEYPGTDEEHMEEQRRLFYVSITRSKRTLVLSRPTMIKTVDARNLGITTTRTINPGFAQLNACPFLRDITRYFPSSRKGEEWDGCAPNS
jgi:superfamily I DNA/RNA helicase